MSKFFVSHPYILSLVHSLGEGIWHWEGMSESEDDYWRSNSSDDDDDLESKLKDNNNNHGSLHYQYFDELHILLDAANGCEDVCIEAIQKLSRQHQISKFINLNDLAKSIRQYCSSEVSRENDIDTSSSSSQSLSYLEKESIDDLILLNLLYAPRRSRLHSIMKVLVRIENMSHICAWTRASKVLRLYNSTVSQLFAIFYC